MVIKKNDKNSDSRFSPKEKIVKYLIENKEQGPFSIRQISSDVKIDYKNTYNYIEKLSAIGTIIKESIGNIKPIKINLSPSIEIINTEKKRTKEFLFNNSKFKLIKQDIENINYPFMVVLVFGSYAKSNQSKQSDIDVCIICDNKSKTEELIRRLDVLTLKLEIQNFTSKEFISMISKKENNLGKEIINHNILLFGFENYYNLIIKWMKKE